MKTTQSITCITLLILLCYSCTEESIIEVEENQTAVEQQIEAKGPSGEFCRFTLQLYAKKVTHPVSGRATCQYDPLNNCVIMDCLPNPFIQIEPPLILVNPCKIIPCDWNIQDPWEVLKFLKPEYLVSFKDRYPIDLNPKEQMVPIRLTENLLVLQTYKEHPAIKDMAVSYNLDYVSGEPNPQPNIYFKLKNNIKLDPEMSKMLNTGLNLIKSGKYPVIYNKKEGTFNIIIRLSKG
ncbi:hypothetical protein [Aquimarina brevivitae]|uniref:Uncharacterized protein n=1 Tax=Aquimarina brevivitae TaxID=323412 RepID=A0A4Q7PJV8_9FLAO|nr:hypothetical protein [Aquimarina brevivitae]RZS99202.1 hypothetical protein EV197_0411 [Aquimarina brevivitae]